MSAPEAQPTLESSDAQLRFDPTPGRWLFLVTIATVLLTLWAMSVPDGFFDLAMIAGAAWFLLGAIWLAGLFTLAFLVRFESPRLREPTRPVWYWLVQPALVVATAALLLTNAPALARYRASRDAMNKTVRAVLAGDRDPDRIKRIGLYRVSHAEKVGRSFRFEIEGAGFIDGLGFAYSAKGPPPNSKDDRFEYWDGHWYIWTHRFD
jgi:hypothetical protein